MNSNTKPTHVINPDKLSEIWNLSWKHTEDAYNDADENEYIYTLSGGQVLAFNNNKPYKINFWGNYHGKLSDLISVEHITRVEYDKPGQKLLLESTRDDEFTQMQIRPTGECSISIGIPTRVYEGASWANMVKKRTITNE